MKNKPSLDHSSLLVSLPALAILLLGCVLAAFWGQWQTALVLMFLFLLAGASRLWAVLSARGLSVAVSGAVRGMFHPQRRKTRGVQIKPHIPPPAGVLLQNQVLLFQSIADFHNGILSHFQKTHQFHPRQRAILVETVQYSRAVFIHEK